MRKANKLKPKNNFKRGSRGLKPLRKRMTQRLFNRRQVRTEDKWEKRHSYSRRGK